MAATAASAEAYTYFKVIQPLWMVHVALACICLNTHGHAVCTLGTPYTRISSSLTSDMYVLQRDMQGVCSIYAISINLPAVYQYRDMVLQSSSSSNIATTLAWHHRIIYRRMPHRTHKIYKSHPPPTHTV